MLAPHEIPSIPTGVKLITLDNGLTIVVREDHSAPVVSAQAWCMAGSVHEGKWLGAGMSHVLEHMLFKGTASRLGARIDQEVQEAGGYMNAYTSFDRTVYHIDVPNTGTRVAIDILCDIMQHATLPEEELHKEMEVIIREMDMNVDDPARRAGRRLFETAYTRSPYRFTVIGYPDIFRLLKPDDIRAYYHEKYAPNNVFFVVAGDVQTGDVVSQIRQAYTTTPARAVPPVVLPIEPTQTASREVVEEAPIELAHCHFAWHIPDLRHPDVPVLDVLAAVLGHGRSSRLYRAVREGRGLVHSVDAWTYSPGSPGLFGMSATADADKFPDAREAMVAEIERLKSQPVSAEELGKAVKQFISGTLASRKTMQGQAQDLGSNWIAANDLNFSERYLAAVKRVTPDDLRRVCHQYLVPENRTLYALLPNGSIPTLSGPEERVQDHSIQKSELPNGLRLLIKEDHRLPFVEFRAVFGGGVLAETKADNGITQLMGRLLLKGTLCRSAEQIATEIESVGGSIDTYGGNNSFGINAEVLSSDFSTGLDLVADVLLHPAFPAAAFNREREIQLAALRDQRDHLLQCAVRSMRRELFGAAGYGLDGLGTEESLKALNPAELAAFHQTYADPRNCVLSVFGDVDPKSVQAAVDQAFGSWKAGQGTRVGSGRPGFGDSKGTRVAGGRLETDLQVSALSTQGTSLTRLVETRDKKQAVLVLGFPGTTLFDGDRYPLELLQEACSDLGSRLFLRVREKLGLAYYVGAQNFPGLEPGYFAFYAGTMPEAAEQVEAELLKEAELLRVEGLAPEELQRAKAKLIGNRKIARQDLGGLAMSTALDELYGLGYQHWEGEDSRYEAVTLDQVRSAARKYLVPARAVVSVIRPPLPLGAGGSA